MGRLLTVAHHTIREAIRMKVVLAFMFLMLLVCFALPFGIYSPDAMVSSNVQTFLSWSLSLLGPLLSFLAIFLSCLSISDEMVEKQIQILVTKPLPRWQYVAGKWLGVSGVLTFLLVFSGLAIYGMTWYLASAEPVNQHDAYKLKNEVLIARAHSSLSEPDFHADARTILRQKVEQGDIEEATHTDLMQQVISLQQRFRSLPPGEVRRFEFRDINTIGLKPDTIVQLRYKARGEGYAPDETLRMMWQFGNPRNSEVMQIPFKGVRDRFHVVPFPANTISPDGTLEVHVQNLEHTRRPQHYGAHIVFQVEDGLEVLYPIGSFEGNLARTLFLIWCRILPIAAVGIFAATLVSFPVACLMAFLFYILCISGKYVKEALDFGAPGEGVLGPAQFIIEPLLTFLFWMFPTFSEYNGVEVLVDGGAVTLKWNIMAFGKLVLLLTTMFLLLGWLTFRRRQVAELSV